MHETPNVKTGVSTLSLTLPSRRGFLRGLSAILAAPAIVTASNLMPVSSRFIGIDPAFDPHVLTFNNGDQWDIVRRAFVPRLQVDIYKSSPLMQLMAELKAEQSAFRI